MTAIRLARCIDTKWSDNELCIIRFRGAVGASAVRPRCLAMQISLQYQLEMNDALTSNLIAMHNIDGPCAAFASMHTHTMRPTNSRVHAECECLLFVVFLIFASIILWLILLTMRAYRNAMTLVCILWTAVRREESEEIESEIHECGPQVHTICERNHVRDAHACHRTDK